MNRSEVKYASTYIRGDEYTSEDRTARIRWEKQLLIATTFQNLRFHIAVHISFSYRMLFLRSLGNYTKLAQRLRVKSVYN